MAVVAYWWAFSIINVSWIAFQWSDNGDGNQITTLMFVIWWMCLLVLLAVAFLIARYVVGPPDYDLNAPPKMRGLRTGLLMLGWAINFEVWWGWAQVLAYMPLIHAEDDSRVGTMAIDAAQQLGMFLALVIVVGLVNYLNSRAILSAVQKDPENVDVMPETVTPTMGLVHTATGRAEDGQGGRADEVSVLGTIRSTRTAGMSAAQPESTYLSASTAAKRTCASSKVTFAS